LARSEIVPIESNQRSIGTNRVSTLRRGDSHSVEKASDSEGGAAGETKPGIDLIMVD